MNPVLNLVKNRTSLRASGDVAPDPEPILRTADDKKIYAAILASGTKYTYQGTYVAPNGAVVVPMMAGSEILLGDKTNSLVYDLNGFILEKRSDGVMVREKRAWDPNHLPSPSTIVPETVPKNTLAKVPATMDLQPVDTSLPSSTTTAATTPAQPVSWKDKLPTWALPAVVGVGGLAVGGGVAYWMLKSKKRR